MKPEDVRNVVLLGHKGAGKTALLEAMLYVGKVTPSLSGSGKERLFDDTPEEEARQGTLEARVASLTWQGKTVNLIDTPGDASFSAEVRMAMMAADAALLVVSAADGLESGTERAFRWVHETSMPCMAVLTKVDDESADLEAVVKEMHDRFKEPVDMMEVPVGLGARHKGVVTVLPPKAYVAPLDAQNVQPSEVPPDLKDEVEKTRAHLVDDVAGTDDALTDKYLEAGDLTVEELDAGLHADVHKGILLPVYVASPHATGDVAALLDALVSLVPPPSSRAPWKGVPQGEAQDGAERPPLADAPLAAFIWKTRIDPHIGKICQVRVISGVLKSDSHFINAADGSKERVGQLMKGVGRELHAINEAVAGEIVAITKLKSGKTGDTLCDDKNPFVLKKAEIPPPLFSRALVLDGKGKEDKISQALHRLAEEDPGLHVSHDEGGREIVLAGAGPLHLDITIDRLRRRTGLECHLGPPKIAYRETITKKVKNVEGKQKKQSGGHGQFGVCYIDVEPLARGAGFEFENAIVGGVIPRQFIPSVEKGVVRGMQKGTLAGYPIVDVKVRLFDGKTHSVDSSDAAFQVAGYKGFREAMKQAGPALLEPVVKMQVKAPAQFMGDVIGDLNSRRGKVLSTDMEDEDAIVSAHVPLAEVLEYEPKLSGLTQGKGTFTQAFDHYDLVPAINQDKIIAQSGYKHKEEEE